MYIEKEYVYIKLYTYSFSIYTSKVRKIFAVCTNL